MSKAINAVISGVMQAAIANPSTVVVTVTGCAILMLGSLLSYAVAKRVKKVTFSFADAPIFEAEFYRPS